MQFEGSTSLHPRCPKYLLVDDGKIKGPFAIRDNAKELASILGSKYRYTSVEMQGCMKHYVLPANMDDDFNIIK